MFFSKKSLLLFTCACFILLMSVSTVFAEQRNHSYIIQCLDGLSSKYVDCRPIPEDQIYTGNCDQERYMEDVCNCVLDKKQCVTPDYLFIFQLLQEYGYFSTSNHGQFVALSTYASEKLSDEVRLASALNNYGALDSALEKLSNFSDQILIMELGYANYANQNYEEFFG